ncbi:peptidase S41 [Lysobacter sp. TY2-98]|uniref:S41 family peptidase n=1 Tax=Lysobacter sp. TY2-98 TaxID=2290922 RepID=UPI000E205E2E|nr:S41 family peptidase [Lysobacter sp. TY2-98]AXK71185.1 peptidase S41 [Lysobacter sp. TY2-98]
MRFAPLLAAAALFAIAATPAAPAVETRIEGAGLVHDVDLLQSAYERLHPGLYRSTTPARMARDFDALRDELRGGATLAQAYMAFSRLAAQVKCGHTYTNFHNQPEAIRSALFEAGRGRVPFHFRWVDQRMIVVRAAASAPDLAPGTEVVSINGVPVREVLAALLPYTRADGANDAKRIAQLQVLGDEKYEPFDVFFALAFPAPGDMFDLVVLRPGETTPQQMRVPGLAWPERLAMRPAVREGGAPWRLDRTRSGFAVLDMPTWALYDTPWDWKAFLTDTFVQLERDHVPALVIDLRANEGGMDIGDGLLAHLIDRPVQRPFYRQLVRYRSVPADLRPHLDTWDRSFDDWGADAIPFDVRYYQLTRWHPASPGEPIAPEAPHYSGRVYVLTSATNSSATFQFAQLLHASGRGTLVGEPTGGNLRGINGSAFYFLRLPHSGIELDLPLVAQVSDSPQPDGGVAPDIVAVPDRASIAAGRDVALEAVAKDLVSHR